ncbi:hypothetical protein PYR71_05020 [Rhizobium sp. MC63]|uniref:Uncharacterized protein n=1 Tax=Rhizobium mulingense TaxID=3031128 RepID=A0ACC6MSE5_9HYPH|nr:MULTISPECIES: hypothetical protein [unclassified Rhizobium]MDF0695883.1 hypothetical protein [Rhizobium sp. MC63]MEA3516295.1 hypothetical protein [Rhizobium sp. MJ31]
MPTYYFHIKHAARVIIDPEGGGHEDLEAAKQEAQESLRELVAQAVLSNRPDIPLAIVVCNVDGEVLASVATDSAIPQIARQVEPSSESPKDGT